MSRLKEIVSWNLWLMPWSAPEVFQRPHDQALKLSQICGTSDSKNLRVVCVQEAWSFRTGVMIPLLHILSSLPRIPQRFYRKHAFGLLDALGFAFMVAIVIQGTAIAWILSLFGMSGKMFIWDPRNILYKQLKQIGYQHRVYANTFDAWWRMFDSGCAIYSTKAPSRVGFVPYVNTGSFNEEALATKGIQYAYFPEERVLIMNTHAKCDCHVMGSSTGRSDVASEIIGMVKQIMNKFDDKMIDEAYICGDFNMTRTSRSISRLSKAFPGSYEISKTAGSCSTYWRDREEEAAIDMVWCLKSTAAAASVRGNWTSDYVRERRRRGSLSPPEDCGVLWGYLWMRSQDSDHLLLRCSTK